MTRKSALRVGGIFSGTLLSLIVAAAIGSWSAHGQAGQVGLTGAEHTDDVIQARQLLMDAMDNEMGPIDAAISGKAANLNDLKNHAYLINTLVSAVPHLFPPETKPSEASDGSGNSTSATLAIWENFDAFYGMAQTAASTAFDASQAADLEKFKELGQSLRATCDACHAQYMHVKDPSNP